MKVNQLIGAALLCIVSLALGCEALSTNESEDPMDQPDFLTPVAQAQELGLKIYWLGESFEVDGQVSHITAGAEILNLSGIDHGLSLTYGLGGPPLSLRTYAPGGEEAGTQRERLQRGAPGASVSSKRVTVGSWQGELFTVSAGTRPTNQLWLFIDVRDSLVVAAASSLGSGIPGDDPSPLIKADLLIATVARELRPYPE